MVAPLVIEAKKIFTPVFCLENGCVVVNCEGNVEYVGLMTEEPANNFERILAPDLWLSPGLIDIHNHGGHGVALGEGDDLEADLKAHAEWLLNSGVTGFLISISAPTRQSFVDMLKTYVSVLEKGIHGARPLGIHLEGMFLNHEKVGAFIPEWLRVPSLDEAKECIDVAGKWIRQVTMAPELPNALEVAREFRKAGITVALGHSNADFETTQSALMGDFSHVTHTYNALSGFNHRAPGALGAVLLSDEITAELIGDGIHVSPAAMRLLVKCLGSDRVVLITDAMMGAGFPDGIYDSFGLQIHVKDGKATTDSGGLAGSVALLNLCARNMHKLAGASVQDSIRMATTNPARAIGLHNKYGVISTGRPADLILMNDQFEIQMTMVGGEILFSKL